MANPKMTHDPMAQSDSHEIPPKDKKAPGLEGRPASEGASPISPLSVPLENELASIARTLAAHGGGDASFDLALDLVLNEVVEQARLATGATGAAIALARDGEMVCRATAGTDAPGLGVRLETTSGLSGACLQTGTIQKCGDTASDSRVNAAASRGLGVKSILILPLANGEAPFGVLEVFSSRPNAFGDRDIATLNVLARRVVESRRRAEEVSALLSNPGEEMDKAPNQLEPSLIEEHISDRGENVTVVEQTVPAGRDILTSVLGVLVIVTAMLLGLVLGWREAIVNRLRAKPQEQATVSTNKQTNQTSTVPAGQNAETVPPPYAEAQAQNVSTPQLSPVTAATSAEPPSGGLVVSQNGKVIFSTPANRSVPTESTAGSGDGSRSRLIHRVEPDYPVEARTQHIQGVVVLDIQIGQDGVVHNVVVVEGNPVLVESARKAVKQWRYQPYVLDGRMVEMQARIKFRFTLPSS